MQMGKGPTLSQLTWFDRGGKPVGTIGVPESYNNARLSPDGHRIATSQIDPSGRTSTVWVHEPARGAPSRLTFDQSQNTAPIWSPDGDRSCSVPTASLATAFLPRMPMVLALTRRLLIWEGDCTSLLGTGLATVNMCWLGKEASYGTFPGRSESPHRSYRQVGPFGTHSFPPMGDGLHTRRMRQATGRFMYLRFQAARASGRSRVQADKSRDGAVTARSYSTFQQTEK
jgi:hypothetical protein